MRSKPSTRRDEAKRRFEIMARQVFIRFKALLMEPSAFAYAERHDNIEAIYKKLTERRDTADVTELLKELHRIVNEADPDAGAGRRSGRRADLRSEPDRPREAARGVRQEGDAQGHGPAGHPAKSSRRSWPEMLAAQPACEWTTTKNTRRSSRTTTARRTATRSRKRSPSSSSLQRAWTRSSSAPPRKGLSEDELALFDLLKKDNLSKADRERVKLASRSLLESVRKLIAPLERWTEKEQTQAEVEVSILDHVFEELPTPPFTADEKQVVAKRVYQHIWQQSAASTLGAAFAV